MGNINKEIRRMWKMAVRKPETIDNTGKSTANRQAKNW
jgi:hypothetical protein